MKTKRKTTIRGLATFLIIIFTTTSIGFENVSAFWNTDNPADGTYRPAATIKIQLMHCNHSDKKDPLYSKHFASNGNHLNITDGDTEVKNFGREPRVNNDYAAGTALPDANKYIYEYEMSYDESEQVDYAVITQPEITHYSDSERAKYPGLREDHVRMYWVGEYDESITELKDAYIEDPNDSQHVIPGTDGDIGWFDFKGMCYPTINLALSQQTWETVGDHEAFQNKKSFVMTQKYGENGQQFLYLLEGTKMVGADGGFYDITKNDKSAAANNHRDQQDTGVPDGYGGHVYALIGL